jgi:hypothetical protein
MANASARNLMVGTGTVTTTANSKELNFSSAQAFKKGSTVIVDYAGGAPQSFTIDNGAGTKWMALQAAPAALSGKAFKTTQTSNSRARGTDGVFVPGASHFMYRSPIDQSGAPDWYHYFDTVFPEKGLHPYTKDQYTGAAVAAADGQPALIPDVATRVRILEGILRAGSSAGDILNPDKRLNDIEARLNALDSGGAITPTVEDCYKLGDV